jgi:hypothetical protein
MYVLNSFKELLKVSKKFRDENPVLCQILPEPKLPARRSIISVQAANKVKKYLDRRDDKGNRLITQAEFEKQSGFDERTVRRVLPKGSATKAFWEATAGVMKITLEDLLKEE